MKTIIVAAGVRAGKTYYVHSLKSPLGSALDLKEIRTRGGWVKALRENIGKYNFIFIPSYDWRPLAILEKKNIPYAFLIPERDRGHEDPGKCAVGFYFKKKQYLADILPFIKEFDGLGIEAWPGRRGFIFPKHGLVSWDTILGRGSR
jgi:hypothetical protein